MVALKNSVCRFVGMFSGSDECRQETHIEHPIGFVQHEMLEPLELRIRLPKMIEGPARRGDQQIDAAAKRMLLRAHAHAAVDCGAGQRRM